MSDDIETLREFLNDELTSRRQDYDEETPYVAAPREALAALDRIKSDHGSLRKALDDRYAADIKAAKAIFAETGRTSGFPSVKDVVAYYVAEVERLEERNTLLFNANSELSDVFRDRDALRAKLDSAKEDFGFLLDRLSEYDPDDVNSSRDFYGHVSPAISRAKDAISELSADAPARPPQLDLRVLTDAELAQHLADLEKQWDALLAALEESGGCSGSPCEHLAEEMDAACTEQKRRAQQTQISDDVREAMAEAERALEPFANAVFDDNGDVTLDRSRTGIASHVMAKSALAKLRSARDEA